MQQFHGFELKILEESETRIRARMKILVKNVIREQPLYEISLDEYIRFFDKKWMGIADFLGLAYQQQVEGDWVVFTVTIKTRVNPVT